MILKDHPLIVRLSPIQGRPYGNECKSQEVRAEGSSCEQEGAQKQVECLPPEGVKCPKKMLGHGHQDPWMYPGGNWRQRGLMHKRATLWRREKYAFWCGMWD